MSGWWCKRFNIDHPGYLESWVGKNISTDGPCGILNAFILASIATSLSNVITTLTCVYINEKLNDDPDLNPHSRRLAVVFTTLIVGMGWSFAVYWVMYLVFGYGKSMIHTKIM
jgi:hypothetical protein